ncbi:MAG: urease accessory protein UreE [Pseudorhodobacter sp.]
MAELPPARQLLDMAPEGPCYAEVVLTQADREIRVRALTTTAGETFIVDLPERRRLDGAFGFVLEDGRIIQITYAREPLLEIRGDLARYAWHIGACNLQCQIEPDRLLVQFHPAIDSLMRALGAQLQRVDEPFVPEAPIRLPHSHQHSGSSQSPPKNMPSLPLPEGDPF